MAWVAVGVGAIGAVGSVLGAKSAAKGQQAAADAAANLQREQYQQTRADNLPALEARNRALTSMEDLAAKYGGAAPRAQDVMAQPGYQFGLNSGLNQLNSTLAAGGNYYSGNALRAGTKFANDYATSKYADAFNQQQALQTNDFNRYASISGQGQTGANAVAGAGANYANNVGGILQGNANAQGAATIAQTNAIGGFANQAGSALNNWFKQPSSANDPNSAANVASNNPYYTDPYSYGAQNGSDVGMRWADGGPVRDEPVIGSRTPLPSGGGGGLSNNALMQIIAQQQQMLAQAQPQPVRPLPMHLARFAQPGTPDGVALLPRNPVMHPQAVLAAQMQQAGAFKDGGPVYGPGDGSGRDDAVPAVLDGRPARLTNGEHVFDVASVNAIGEGDNDLGQHRLNKLRAMLKGGHHGA